MTPADRFSAAVTLALELPTPEAIWRAILATADDGLRAANYEARVRGGGATAVEDPDTGETYSIHLTTTERTALRDRHDDQGEGLILSRARERFIDAIAALNAICVDAGAPDSWDDATKDAHILYETGVLQAAIDTGRDVMGWINQTENAVRDVRGVHDRHMPHTPSDTDRLINGDPICLSHARIGDYERPRHGKLHICKTCYDLLAKVGNPAEQHHDPHAWPPIDLLREHADMERTGRRKDYRTELNLWLERRGARRSA